MEVSAVVVLGDGADGVSDVRVDGLGKVSLYCGYFWGNGYGHIGIFRWELGNGEEEGGDDGWCGDDEFLNREWELGCEIFGEVVIRVGSISSFC